MILLFFQFLGCDQNPEKSTQEQNTPSESNTYDSAEEPTVDFEDQTQGGAEFSPQDRKGGRDFKRMSIPKLKASIRLATGLDWTEGSGTSGQDMLTGLEKTLGVPDYRYSVIEDTAPSLVFEKFLTDAASSVCTKLISQQSPIFFVHASIQDTWSSNPQAIEDNIRHQLLRFHGLTVDSDDLELNQWEWLWRTVYTQSDGELENRTAAAWRTLCTALIIHPRFAHY